MKPITRCVLHNIGHHDLFIELFTKGGDRIGWCRPLSKSVAKIGEVLYKHIEQSTVSYFGQSSLRFEIDLSLPANTYRFEYNEKSRDSFIDRDTFELLRGEVMVRSVYAPLVQEIVLSHEPIEYLVGSPGRKQATRPKSLDEISQVLIFLITAGQDKSSPLYIAKVIQKIIALRWAQDDNIDESKYSIECEHVNTNPHSITPSQLLSLERRVVSLAATIAERHGEQWRDLFKLYLSVSTGTTFMISALTLTFAEWSPVVQTISSARHILACTPSSPSRVYRPKDKELASIKEWVAVDEVQLDSVALLAVNELRRWRTDYIEQRQLRPTELKESNKEAVFFHRKGLKEVLCVLVIIDRHGIEGDPGDLVAIRGINLEVSLPTGTLCAERNAIGTALCRFPRLERRDIQAVAVLSLDPSPKLANLGPCGACAEWLSKVHEVSPSLNIISFGSPEAERIFIKPALHI